MHRSLWIVLLVACGGGHAAPDAGADASIPIDAELAPVFRNPVTLPDDQLATQALQLIGADVTGAQQECDSCHGLTRQHLAYWRALSDTSLSTCLTDLAVTSQASAKQMMDCLRATPTDGNSDFQTTKLGIFATAARLPWFQYTFAKAYGDSADAYTAFETAVAMPRAKVPQLTQPQFDIVAEYFIRGLPMLDQLLPVDPQPMTCDAGISSDVAAHVATMKTTGWRAVNADNHMDMYDCGTATDPRNCLADKLIGSAQPYGTKWDVAGAGQLRVLKDVTYHSEYWSRSSPDGRFIAHGAQDVAGGFVIDLQRDAVIPINAEYDPGFFPDNTGFVMQAGPNNVCAMSVLTSNPASVTMTEPSCTQIDAVGLYQHVGRMLNGGDIFTIDSEFVSDDGGKSLTSDDPEAFFGPHGYNDFTPLIFDGTMYQQQPQVTIGTAYEGDSVMSPSTGLVISRVAGASDQQIGYVLRKVNATLTGSTYTIETPEIARYCISGGKPAFSFDERYIVYHHYIGAKDAVALGFSGPGDPAFAPYLTLGASNLYLMELTTGVVQRITNMAPGQYALFPHFRSDGWIYADIRDNNAVHEYFVASDAALIAEQP
jgi:hypothetical protein